MTSSTLTKPKRKKVRRVRSYSPTGLIGRRLDEAQALHLEMQRLKAKLDVHRAWILLHMQDRKIDKITHGDLVIDRKIRHDWTYSPATEREMNKIRVTQKYEQAEGIAKDDPAYYVSFSHPMQP